MKNILHIISSPRSDASYSIKLGNAVIEKLTAAYPGSMVHTRHLVEDNFPHLEQSQITSFFTPAESRTASNLAAIRQSDEAIREITDADILVIGAPMYNYTIHSSLKAWLDHIVRAGETFRYDANGLEGLVKNKKAYIAVATGGVYSEGPMQGHDFVVPYLKTILAHIGITDVSVVRVEGTAVPALQDGALERGIMSIVL